MCFIRCMMFSPFIFVCCVFLWPLWLAQRIGQCRLICNRDEVSKGVDMLDYEQQRLTTELTTARTTEPLAPWMDVVDQKMRELDPKVILKEEV